MSPSTAEALGLDVTGYETCELLMVWKDGRIEELVLDEERPTPNPESTGTLGAPRRLFEAVAFWLAMAAILYVPISMTFYAWRNPDLTQTQVMFRAVDAILWR